MSKGLIKVTIFLSLILAFFIYPFSDILEFLLIQAAAFVLFTFLRLVLEKVFGSNLQSRRYCNGFSELICSYFLKSVVCLWNNSKSFLENRLKRNLNHLESVPFQKKSGCPTESLLESTSSEISSNNETGSYSQTASPDSDRRAEDLLPYHSSSRNAPPIQSATPRTLDHSQFLPSQNRRLMTSDNTSLRPQRNEIQRISNLSSSTDQVFPPERYVIQALGKWYRPL